MGNDYELKEALAILEPRLAALAAQANELQHQITALQRGFTPGARVANFNLVLPELHDPASGRIDAERLAEFMAVPLKRLCEGLGLNYKAVHRTPAAEAFQPALQPVKRALELLHGFFAAPGPIRIWLNTPHPDLDGRNALELILANNTEAVLRILENAAAGVPV